MTRDTHVNLAVLVRQVSPGRFVATCEAFPDLRAEADSNDGAAAELALKIRDRLVALTGAQAGTIRHVTKVSDDPS